MVGPYVAGGYRRTDERERRIDVCGFVVELVLQAIMGILDIQDPRLERPP
jgi:hypothetical protein